MTIAVGWIIDWLVNQKRCLPAQLRLHHNVTTGECLQNCWHCNNLPGNLTLHLSLTRYPKPQDTQTPSLHNGLSLWGADSSQPLHSQLWTATSAGVNALRSDNDPITSDNILATAGLCTSPWSFSRVNKIHPEPHVTDLLLSWHPETPAAVSPPIKHVFSLLVHLFASVGTRSTLITTWSVLVS